MKSDNYGLVSSSQTGIHPNLERYVQRHLDKPWSQPFHVPSAQAFRCLISEGALSEAKAFILDSGCGTGKSTRRLAELFPRHIVIGVDQSQVRLAKSGVDSGFLRNGNCILLRAELSTFWRLLLADGYVPERHFLFYPNPWPKPGHLKRRWHGHPVFPQLLSLGGEIEMRCNWGIYAAEFAQAVSQATGADIKPTIIHPDSGISPFEQKYLERGQTLFSVTVPAPVTKKFRD
jgi:tRNA (guanine-N7-)-methyltransferase